jgi:hypothetical protein
VSLTLDPLPPLQHLPRLTLEEAAVAPPSAEVTTHLIGCASCRTYVETLRENAARFLRAHPTDRFLSQLAWRSRGPARSWLPAASLLATAAAGALALLLLLPDPSPAHPPAALQAVQLKGSLVSTFVQRQGQAISLRAGDALHPNDAVRFVVRAEQAGFAAVLERDPDGRVTVIAPFGATRPQPVAPGSTALPDSAILDSTVGKDHFVAVFSTEPFAIAPLMDALSTSQVIACEGCRVETLEFDKSP